MPKKEPMQPPYYILVNDKDLEHIKFYHEFYSQGLNYEGEFGNWNKAIAYTKKQWIHSSGSKANALYRNCLEV